MPFDAVFDARAIEPKQGGGRHPPGNKYPFVITATVVKATKAEEGQQPKGGLFAVEFTSPAGSITHNYNLWNESDMARKIAGEQLSALCHATGIFTVDFKNDGAALRGAKGLMDIGFQKGQEPSLEKPDGGYVEIKKIYDINGNEPGKAAVPQQQTIQQPQQNVQQPNQPQVQTGFQQPVQQQPQQNGNASWGNAGQVQQPQQQATPAGQSWNAGVTGGAMPEKAPWGG